MPSTGTTIVIVRPRSAVLTVDVADSTAMGWDFPMAERGRAGAAGRRAIRWVVIEFRRGDE